MRKRQEEKDGAKKTLLKIERELKRRRRESGSWRKRKRVEMLKNYHISMCAYHLMSKYLNE